MSRMHGPLSCALVLTATSALADPPSASQRAIQSRARTRDEFGQPVPNDDTARMLTKSETKQLPEPDPEKAHADPPAAPVAASPAAGVRVKMMTGDPRIALFRMLARFDAVALTTRYGWIPVVVLSEEPILECATPCSKTVDRRFSYRVAGEGITPSAPFQFPSERTAYNLEVTPGSSSSHTVGIILTTAGICLAAFGGGFLLVGAVDREGPAFVPVVGAIGGGAGLVSIAIGIPLWISGGTSVRVDAAMNEPRLRLPAGLALGAQGITF